MTFVRAAVFGYDPPAALATHRQRARHERDERKIPALSGPKTGPSSKLSLVIAAAQVR